MKLQFSPIPYSQTIGHGDRSVRLVGFDQKVHELFRSWLAEPVWSEHLHRSQSSFFRLDAPLLYLNGSGVFHFEHHHSKVLHGQTLQTFATVTLATMFVVALLESLAIYVNELCLGMLPCVDTPFYSTKPLGCIPWTLFSFFNA